MALSELIELDTVEGVYHVRGKPWPVSQRYTLHEHIGAGSYGDVCRATDNVTGESVALKRVADVLCCPMLAKRVLREVCIMRRLEHPYVIRLADVFTRKSTEVDNGLDLYIATEFASGGDLYRLKETLAPQDVQMLIWQLLVGTRYLHSCHVWHRDIKSENTLLLSNMTVKICDFGLSRSALGVVNVQSAQLVDTRTAQMPATPAGTTRTQSGNASTQSLGRKVLQRQYTKMVVTPSYRAPEVVMSRGQYTSSIDIWSVGCIFWELLMRQMNSRQLGPPSRPLFGVRGEPATPECGEQYVDDGDSPLNEQLDVIFNVIGTPCWSDIESVPSDAWRSYLKRLPGRAGNLAGQMVGCGDREAVDLLSRMLAFDPARRCTADEALSHTYFRSLKKPISLPPVAQEDAPVALPLDQHFWQISDPAIALGLLERELELSTHDADGGRQKLDWLLGREVEQQQLQNQVRHVMLRNMAAAHQQRQVQAQVTAAHMQAAALRHAQVQAQQAQVQQVQTQQPMGVAQGVMAQHQAQALNLLRHDGAVSAAGLGSGAMAVGNQQLATMVALQHQQQQQLLQQQQQEVQEAVNWQQQAWAEQGLEGSSGLAYQPLGEFGMASDSSAGTASAEGSGSLEWMSTNGFLLPRTIIRQGSLVIEHPSSQLLPLPPQPQQGLTAAVMAAGRGLPSSALQANGMETAAEAAVRAVDNEKARQMQQQQQQQPGARSRPPAAPRPGTVARRSNRAARSAVAIRQQELLADELQLPRRSPRLRDLHPEELPHRKRVATLRGK